MKLVWFQQLCDQLIDVFSFLYRVSDRGRLYDLKVKVFIIEAQQFHFQPG